MNKKTGLVIFIIAIIVVLIFIAMNYIRSEIYSSDGNPIKNIYVKNVPVKVEVVNSKEKIEKGLAGRASISPGRGMLFLMPNSDYQKFWMKGMQFSIDIIWISQDKVTGCEKNISPQDDRIFTSPAPSSSVLEVPEGFCDKNMISVNDSIRQ
ncbi:MAG: DUF192 domain-containing protein [Parcubacteria group bacterium]|jgi:uncharacterized membrane protein (UPF0127 family)